MRLRTGKTQLVVSASGNPPTYKYHFDPSRPESVLARNAVDDALERAAGRVDLLKSTDETASEPGGRYVDFLVPGLLGMSLMGGGLMGRRLCDGRHADSQVGETLSGHADEEKRISRRDLMVSRMLFMIPEVFIVLLFARLCVRRASITDRLDRGYF